MLHVGGERALVVLDAALQEAPDQLLAHPSNWRIHGKA